MELTVTIPLYPLLHLHTAFAPLLNAGHETLWKVMVAVTPVLVILASLVNFRSTGFAVKKYCVGIVGMASALRRAFDVLVAQV